MWTTEVENFPGFPKGVQGPELISLMRQQAERFGTQILDENAIKVEGSFEVGFATTTDGDSKQIKSKTVIIATGASAKWLGLESERRLRGKGVSACATCDGFFFKGKTVAVVGAGDAAMEEALFLTKFAEKVYVLVRRGREDVKASKIMYDRAVANQKIEFKFHTEVIEVLGDQTVSGLKVRDNQSGKEYVMDDVKGLFVAIGHKPNTEFLLSEGGSLIELGKFGYALTKECTRTQTIKEGVFVAGDVADHIYRQAITAAGFGCMAALDCIKFLSEKA